MPEIRVIDGAPTIGARKDYGFSRTNTKQSYAKKNAEPRESGFSRVDRTGQPGSRQLQGFDQILQGIQQADEQDREDWDFAVTMAHPEVLNGIQAMQGKAKRQEKKAARQEKRATKKDSKVANSATAGKVVRPKKAARQAKKNDRVIRRTEKKDLKLAKKEERVLRKTDRRDRRNQNHEARRERKADRNGNAKEIFDNLGDSAKDVISNLISRPDNFDTSTLEMHIPDGASGLLDRWRDMDMEDVLDEREELLSDEAMPNRLAQDAATGAENVGDGEEDGGGGGGMLIAGLGIAAALALSSGGKKTKKKK